MGTFKLGKMTFGSLFKKPETIMYPVVTKPKPAGLKGHIVVDVNQCILCGMCDRNCSTGCITVDKKERYWQINPYACIQCGYCVTVCPKSCLHMDPHYWAAAPEIDSVRFTVPESDKPQKAEKPDAVKEAAEPKLAVDVPQKGETPAAGKAAGAPMQVDAQLEMLLRQLDSDKAKIVESALAAE